MPIATRQGRLAGIAVAILLVLGVASSLPTVARDTRTLLLVFPPWWSRSDVWQAALATGEIVTDVWSFAVVLHSVAGDFPERARQAGAILILDPGGLGSCGTRPEEGSP